MNILIWISICLKLYKYHKYIRLGLSFFYYTSITSEHVQTSVPLLSTVICPEKAHFIHNLTLLLPTLTKKKKTKKISIFERYILYFIPHAIAFRTLNPHN